jgi:hypothetical protein
MTDHAAPTPAESAGKPADLVLEGGGVKGIGLAGAVIALDQAGYRFQRSPAPAPARSLRRSSRR